MCQVVLLLAGVALLAAVCTRVSMRRLSTSGKFLRVIEAVAVAPGKHVVLVQAGKSVMLIGIADKSMTHLATMSKDDLAHDAIPDTEPVRYADSVFQQLLERIKAKKSD